MRAATWRRGLSRALVVAALALVALWVARRPVLVAVAGALVAEDALAPVDAIVISNAAAREDALEAARLYREGLSPRLVFCTWIVDPLDAELRRIGVPYLDPTALTRAILERSGVPTAAITQLAGPVAGTEDEVAATAAYVRDAGLRSVLLLAPRTHTARARWLLRRRVAATVRVLVRSAPLDPFAVDGWWRSREQSRDVMSEYLRWLNSALLGDAWRAGAARG